MEKKKKKNEEGDFSKHFEERLEKKRKLENIEFVPFEETQETSKESPKKKAKITETPPQKATRVEVDVDEDTRFDDIFFGKRKDKPNKNLEVEIIDLLDSEEEKQNVEKKPNEEDAREPKEKLSTPAEGEKTWECPKCTFKNPESRENCEMCETNRFYKEQTTNSIQIIEETPERSQTLEDIFFKKKTDYQTPKKPEDKTVKERNDSMQIENSTPSQNPPLRTPKKVSLKGLLSTIKFKQNK